MRKFYKRQTKIVCTIGPASNTTAVVERLIAAGMNVARLNLAHGTLDDHDAAIQIIKKVGKRLGRRVAILVDLPGPKYRIGKLDGGQVTLKRGTEVTFTSRQVVGNTSLVPVTLPNLAQDLRVGDTIVLDDGAMRLKVLGKEGDEVRCRVLVGGTLTERRGLSVPGMRSSLPFISDSLREQVIFAIKQKADYIAISFVSSAGDVNSVRTLIESQGDRIPIIAKIEGGAAVTNFDSILAVSDGIMVARGDLGVDIPLEKVPVVQKDIILKCNRAGKPVITATQMLESMVNSASPTRAEVADVANAIFDGTDATMLSGETAIGKYPVPAIKIMARVAEEAEKKLPYDEILLERGRWLEQKTEELISYNACYTAYSLNAKAIVAFTQSGSTAGRVSKYRPRVPVLAITPDSAVASRLLLYWGVYPFKTEAQLTVEKLFATGARLARELGLAKVGDLIVITGGIPVGVVGSTNLLKVERI